METKTETGVLYVLMSRLRQSLFNHLQLSVETETEQISKLKQQMSILKGQDQTDILKKETETQQDQEILWLSRLRLIKTWKL